MCFTKPDLNQFKSLQNLSQEIISEGAFSVWDHHCKGLWDTHIDKQKAHKQSFLPIYCLPAASLTCENTPDLSACCFSLFLGQVCGRVQVTGTCGGGRSMIQCSSVVAVNVCSILPLCIYQYLFTVNKCYGVVNRVK